MIVLRKGEELRRRYPGRIKDLGIGKGALYFTDRRVCFESDKKGMCLQVYYDKLYNWTKKKRSIVLRWREPQPGQEIRVGDHKFDVEVEPDGSKFNGDRLTTWEVSKSLYYQVVKYHRIGYGGAGLYFDDYSNVYHWWYDTEDEQKNPVVSVKPGTKLGQLKDIYDDKDLYIYSDGKPFRNRLVAANDIMQGVQWTMLSYCWKKYVGFENEYVDKGVDRLIGNRTEEMTHEEYEKKTGDPIPVHGSLLEQDMIENVKMWKMFSESGILDKFKGIIKEESFITKEDAIRYNNKNQENSKRMDKTWIELLHEYEKTNNIKELEKIYPANDFCKGGTIYDMVEFAKKAKPAFIRTAEIMKNLIEKGAFELKSLHDYLRIEGEIGKILIPLALDGKDVSKADPDVKVTSLTEVVQRDIRRHRSRNLTETV